MATATQQRNKPQQQPPQPTRNVPAPTKGNDMVHLQRPDYLPDEKSQASRGNEHVGVEDVIIPRLEIVQALSPCKKRSDPQFIDGAEDGMLYNNVTRELYGDEVLLLPVYFRKEYLVWKDRKKHAGSDGFRGAYPTAEAAAQRISEADDDDTDLQIIDTAQQFCLLVHGGDRIEEVVVSMARSKMKVSRRWNSLIRLAGGDRFSRIYKMTTVEEKGKKGEFHNFNIEVFGFPAKKLYELAGQKYDQIAKGGVKADYSNDAIDPDDNDHSQDGTRRSGSQDY